MLTRIQSRTQQIAIHLVRIMVLFTGLVTPARAAETTLWEIGRCDNDYAEFAIAGCFEKFPERFPGQVRFEIGKGDSAQQWPYVHPGPSDIWAGGREHPYEIVFDLDQEPVGAYLLRVDIIDTHAALAPSLQLKANGTDLGEIELQRGTTGTTIKDPQGGREQIIEFFIPRSALVRGPNNLTLSVSRHSWLLYDNLTLMHRTEIQPVENLSARSTVLFREEGGSLRQIIQVTFDLYEQPVAPFVVTFAGDQGWQVTQSFTALRPGLARELKCEVPPLDVPRDVEVSVSLDGRRFVARSRLLPQKQWKLYMLAQSHFDLGYTAPQEECLRRHRENTENVMDWMARQPHFAWTMEAMLAEDYLARGSKPARFIELARQGRIGVLGFYANMLTGLCSGEELSHTLDVYDELRRNHGIASRCATMSDVPSMVATVPMILNEHGVRYLSLGGNYYRGMLGDDTYETPHYWASPDGSRVLLWKGLNVLGIASPPEQHHVTEAAMQEYLARFIARQDYPYDAVLLHGYYTDNSPVHESVAHVVHDWNSRYAWPKLIQDAGPSFFEYLERSFASSLVTKSGDQGVFWEDGAASSARETAAVRSAGQQVITAEKLAIFAGSKDSAFRTACASAWRNVILYNEHTWGDDESVTNPFIDLVHAQWAGKKAFADQAANAAQRLLHEMAVAAAKRIDARGKLIVFNPSSWSRSEWVEVIDPDGQRREVYAENVPGLGYACITTPENMAPKESPAEHVLILENRYYRLTFDPATGAVASLFDRTLNRELVDAGDYKLNEYLYVTGGENSRLTRGWTTNLPTPQLRIHRCAQPRFTRLTRPGRQVMRVHSEAPMTREFSVEVVLYEHEKRVDFINHMDKEANLAKEAGYFAFPLALSNPQVRIEIPSGVIRAGVDQVFGGCRDWFAAQQFVTVAGSDAAVTLSPVDAPLLTVDDIHRGQWYTTLAPRTGYVFSYAFNNYWDTNYRAYQSGPLTFRFSLTSDATIPDTRAKQFGESVQVPLVGVWRDGSLPSNRSPSGESGSFLPVAGEDIVVQSMRRARFEPAIVLVLRNMSSQPRQARIGLSHLGITQVRLSNLAEDPGEGLTVENATVNVRCRPLGLTILLLSE